MIDRRIGKIKVRRGTNDCRKTIIFDEGELLYTTDTKRMYVGDGKTLGGILVSNKNIVTVMDSTIATDSMESGDLVYNQRKDITYIVDTNRTLVPILIGCRGLLGVFENYLPLAGGTMYGSINMADNKVYDVPWPAQNKDAVPKIYVDKRYKELYDIMLGLKKQLDDIGDDIFLVLENDKNKRTYNVLLQNNKNIYSEGETAVFLLDTVNVPNETVLYWEILGTITAPDILGNIYTGEVTINNNKGTINVSFLVDSIPAEVETARLLLKDASGVFLAASPIITLRDEVVNEVGRLLTTDGTPIDTSEGNNILSEGISIS
jgi:hypothetical protein